MDRRTSLLDFPERLDPWQRFLPYALLLIVTLALYGATLYFSFVWDDFFYIHRNDRVQGLSPLHLRMIWTSTFLGHYAPIHHTFLALLYSLSALEPFGYHLAQLVVHAGCVWLLYFLLQKLESPRIALLASLLFAVYPANIETIAWISESKSTLAFFFFLLSFWAFLRLRERERWGYGVWCGFFLVLSMLAKINTIVAPAIFLLSDYKQRLPFTKERVRSLVWFFLIAVIFAGVHLASFYRSQKELTGFYHGGLIVHLENMPRLVLYYIGMVIFPHPLSAVQTFEIYGGFSAAVGIAWIALLGLAWLLYRSNRSVQFWGLWFLIFLAPVLQLFPFEIWAADRYLYIPAVGGFVLASKGFFRVADRWTKLGQRVAWETAMGAILLAFAWHTHHHLPVWRNELTLWETTVRTCMTSEYCHSHLGAALVQDGQTERGVQEFMRAFDLQPSPEYLLAVGDAYTLYLGDYRQALMAYNMALQRGAPPTAGFYARLARAHLLAGNWKEAGLALQASKRINPNETGALVIDSFLQWKLGNLEEARQSLQKALAQSGQTANAAGFIHTFWRDRAEVGRLLADLRSSPSPRGATVAP